MDQQRLQQLRTMPYELYLKTDEWREKRELALERDGYRCRLCDTREQLHVHHRTYARRGNERLDDLTTLCDRCHNWFHEKIRQDELMAMTYSPPSFPRTEEEIARSNEDFLIGLLLQDTSFVLHVCGILSGNDFFCEDTRALYTLLNEHVQQHNVSQALVIPPDLEETAKRAVERIREDEELIEESQKIQRIEYSRGCRNLLPQAKEKEMQRFEQRQREEAQTQKVKSVVGCAMTLKRKTLERRLGEIKQQMNGASKDQIRQLAQEMIAIHQQLKVLTIAKQG